MRTVGYDYKHQIEVDIFNDSGFENPEYAKSGDAGVDVRSTETKMLYPGETTTIKTGLYVALPFGYELQVRPRSGLSLKTKMRVANSPGTIDSNYRGEICIIVDNIGELELHIQSGDRVAQLVLSQVPTIKWHNVQSKDELTETVRGSAGFGSTGV